MADGNYNLFGCYVVAGNGGHAAVLGNGAMNLTAGVLEQSGCVISAALDACNGILANLTQLVGIGFCDNSACIGDEAGVAVKTLFGSFSADVLPASCGSVNDVCVVTDEALLNDCFSLNGLDPNASCDLPNCGSDMSGKEWGIVLGTIAAFGLLIAACWYFTKRRSSMAEAGEEQRLLPQPVTV